MLRQSPSYQEVLNLALPTAGLSEKVKTHSCQATLWVAELRGFLTLAQNGTSDLTGILFIFTHLSSLSTYQ